MSSNLETAPASGERPLAPSAITSRGAVDLYWIPLGAGGHSVWLNGKMYEAISSFVDRRPRCDIYHSALTILVPDALFTVEMTPIPNGRGWERGVVAEGAVGSRWAGRLRIFRYEVRRWRNGSIPDLQFAVAPPIQLTDQVAIAQRVLDVLPSVPTVVWGRDELQTGEMWSCNSIISWALTRAGVDAEAIDLPPHGRAPGWYAGIDVGQRQARRDSGLRTYDFSGRARSPSA